MGATIRCSLNNYAAINLVDKIGSIPGVGDARLAAQQTYGMRVWCNPDKMAKLRLTATDITNAIQEQNRQNPAGSIGQPPVNSGVGFSTSGERRWRLLDPQQFDDIVVRAQPDTAVADCAISGGQISSCRRLYNVQRGKRRAYGRADREFESRSATRWMRRIGQECVSGGREERPFPAGIEYKIAYDATQFVRASIKDVAETLFEAMGLVILVVFVFLQNWRATLIPLCTVPVAVVGTFALFPLLGFSINMTSMFGLVLAIGIVVDDAIVVVEAVQLNIDRGMTPREATMHAMAEVSGPVVAIACILGAVFIPVAFLGGIAGLIYRQFALTIAASVLISAFSALSLSPALCAGDPAPETRESGACWRACSAGFNRAFDWTLRIVTWAGGAGGFLRMPVLTMVALAGVLFMRRAGCSKSCCRRDFCRTKIRAWCSARDPACRTARRWSARESVTEQVDAILPLDPGRDPGRDGAVRERISPRAPRHWFQRRHDFCVRSSPWVGTNGGPEIRATLGFDKILAQARPQVSRRWGDGAGAYAFGMPPIQGPEQRGRIRIHAGRPHRHGRYQATRQTAAQLVLDNAAAAAVS